MNRLSAAAYFFGICLSIGAICGAVALIFWASLMLALHQPDVFALLVVLTVYGVQMTFHWSKVRRLNARIDQLEHDNEMLKQAHDALVRWG